MTKQINDLITTRGAKKGQVTRTKKYLEQLESPHTAADIANLDSRLKKLKVVETEFDDVQTKIEVLQAVENVENTAAEAERSEFETEIHNLMAQIKVVIEEFRREEKLDEMPLVATPSTSAERARRKLPELSIPSFSGNITTWIDFKNQFQSIIGNDKTLTNLEKLYYLKGGLKGDAQTVISAIDLADSNYVIAWETLCNRYDNTDLIINNHLRLIFEHPPISKPSAKSLRELIDVFQTNVRCLNNLKEPTESWSTILIYFLKNKLDVKTREQWEMRKRSKTNVTFATIVEFLTERWEILSVEEIDSKATKVSQPKIKSFPVLNNYKLKCNFCSNEEHSIYNCELFAKMSVNDRIIKARELKLCLNCLKRGHRTRDCRNNMTCRECHKKHHTLVHIVEPAQTEVIATSCGTVSANTQTLLATCVVKVKNNFGEFIDCRAFLDCGSQASYITRALCVKLRLPTETANIQIVGIGNKCTNILTSTIVTLNSKHGDFSRSIKCLLLDTITDFLPIHTFSSAELKIPSNIHLADPFYNISQPIDMLLGADIFWDIIKQTTVTLNRHTNLRDSHLGWIVCGHIPQTLPKTKTVANHALVQDLELNLRRLWQTEAISTLEPAHHSDDYIAAEESFKNTTKLDNSGRFIVSYPLRNECTLGDSRFNAEKRFHSLEKRFKCHPELKTSYSTFIKEYLNLGHMRHVEDSYVNSQSLHYYLPHHAVLKAESLTSKLRVVFDGSCPTSNGKSLNQIQYIGPPMCRELYDILLNFRFHKYVLCGDICKMYRQIRMNPDHCPLQLILWRDNENDTLKTYELLTVTYGTASAPFLATRCIRQVSMDCKEEFPVESQILENNIYVDDLITGCNNKNALIKYKENIIKILLERGFELRKLLSNDPDILGSPNPADSEFHTITTDETKLLGIRWNANVDLISFQNITVPSTVVTKRNVLSVLAKIFDPLGLISPFTANVKFFMQSLWEEQLKWDDEVSQLQQENWHKISCQLKFLEKIEIPRRVSESDDIELHGFSDASEKGYGACVYVRSKVDENSYACTLLTSKSRVAPLQKISLPRLELCGALLLARLMSNVVAAVNQNVAKRYMWIDSTITLAWISKPSSAWKTYVANRVSEIHSLSDPADWRHVSSADNPADLISRGSRLESLMNSTLWWHGPSWLTQDNTYWPTSKCHTLRSNEIPEGRIVAMVAQVSDSVSHIHLYSNLNRLIHVTGYMIRFYNNLRCPTSERVLTRLLSTNERSNALHYLIRMSQRDSFNAEITRLENKKLLKSTSNLLSLNPYLDEKHILRVGGRLKHVACSQILLDSKHKLTLLIAEHLHKTHLHCGAQTLLYAMRHEYWPLGGRNFTRKIVRRCVTCVKAKPNFSSEIMASLPIERISPSPPFYNCGIDLAGPITTKDRKGRGCKTTKSYVALFVCFSTKAYHLEIVSDLSTSSFLAAFRRFIARRGKPQRIFSDNGTNFVGANNHLQDAYKHMKESSGSFDEYFGSQNVTWTFIPPRAPHFGGLWESGIRSVKSNLARVTPNLILTYEELSTIACQIEAILNSRPLSPMSSDPTDLVPLSPSHFLIGRPLTSAPDTSLEMTPQNRLQRFQLCQQATQSFWSRWQKEYLCHLQQRSKWKQATEISIKEGQLIILKEDNVPVCQWMMGRIDATHPGSDGKVRVVTIRLPSRKLVKRPITKICLLPIE